MVAPDLPPDLLRAPKRGFSVPLEEWWRVDAKKLIRDNLQSLHPAITDYVNPPYVITLLDEHQRGRRNHAQRLWSLWVLNSWAWENFRN